jgi:hypothetical protein
MNTATVPRRRATARDLRYFASPAQWPHYPFLPVVRRIANDKERQCGVPYDARGVSGAYGYTATVLLANVFVLPRTEAALLARSKCVYDSLHELADDGWRLG